MMLLIVNENLHTKLPQITQPAELCDANGRVLGRYFPAREAKVYYNLEPQISEEELQRREQANEKTYTTAEVLDHLKKL